MIRRCFIDSSVFYSAIYSNRGYAHELFSLALQGKVILVVSEDVLNETRRNLVRKAGEQAVFFFDRIVAEMPCEFVEPTKREVSAASEHVVEKDAHILAAAKKADVDFLVTLDRRHLLGKVEPAEYLQGPIIEPEEAVRYLRTGETKQKVFEEKYRQIKP
jgi:predicted nucleic acid-binding protein